MYKLYKLQNYKDVCKIHSNIRLYYYPFISSSLHSVCQILPVRQIYILVFQALWAVRMSTNNVMIMYCTEDILGYSLNTELHLIDLTIYENVHDSSNFDIVKFYLNQADYSMAEIHHEIKQYTASITLLNHVQLTSVMYADVYMFIHVLCRLCIYVNITDVYITYFQQI